jgi:uncharacterized protein YggE
METTNINYKNILSLVGIILGLSLVVLSISAAYYFSEVGREDRATVTVTGEGEVFAKPDIATISFTVREEDKDAISAQKKTEEKVTAGLKALSSINVDEKDIKTISYNVSPKYIYEPVVCKSAYCPSNQKIDGYYATESIQVKIRDTENAGKALGLLGGVKITDISGPNFSIDDEEKLKAEAREKAINNAKEKAEVLAKQLGGSIDEVLSFSENGGGYMPMAYGIGGGAEMSSAKIMSDISLPKGENSVKVNVNITYKIRQ